jgi:tRNA(Ile2) C34 agmatinyltransferase TiaS
MSATGFREVFALIYIGLDDTDNKTSRGTGRLARGIAGTLSERFKVLGITRHQLLVDPRVPYTSHNSSATLHLMEDGNVDLSALADEVQALMLADFQEGSDPGLCVARTVAPEMTEFGRRAKTQVLRQSEARDLANRCGCILRGLGGTQDGVIGALAGVGLAATGEDGRFILIGTMRELDGVQTVQAILDSGIRQVRSMDGQTLKNGQIDTGGRLRPACREGQPILFVKPQESDPSLWVQVKLD